MTNIKSNKLGKNALAEVDQMKEEVLILPARRESVFKDGDFESDFTEFVKSWDAKGPIDREPAYVAFYVKGKGIKAIAEVDFENSRLKEGIVATKGEPIRVTIPVRFKPRT